MFLALASPEPFGINARGDIVGEYDNSAGAHGFLLSRDEFTTIDIPGATFTVARGINAPGEIVGLFRSADNITHGFLLSEGESISIDFPGTTGGTTAFGINARGDIVGSFCDAEPCDAPSLHQHGYLLWRDDDGQNNDGGLDPRAGFQKHPFLADGKGLNRLLEHKDLRARFR